MDARSRPCPFRGCGVMLHPKLYACGFHWSGMSDPHRLEIWKCYRAWETGQITLDELHARQNAVLAEADPEPNGET